MRLNSLGMLIIPWSLVAAPSVAQEAGIYCLADVTVEAVGPSFNRLLFAPRSGFVQSTERELLISVPYLFPPSPLDPLLVRYLSAIYSGNADPSEVFANARLLDVLIEGQDLASSVITTLAGRRVVDDTYSFFDPQMAIELSQTMRLLEGYRQEIDQSISDLTIVEAQIARNLNERTLLMDLQMQERRLSSILSAPALYSSQWSLIDSGPHPDVAPPTPNPSYRSSLYGLMLSFLNEYFPDSFGSNPKQLYATNALRLEMRLASERRNIEVLLMQGEAQDLLERSERMRRQLEYRQDTLQSLVSEIVAKVFYDVSTLIPCQNCVVQLSEVGDRASFVPAGVLLGRISDDLGRWTVQFPKDSTPENQDGIMILPASAEIETFNLVIDDLGERLYINDKFFASSWFAFSDLTDFVAVNDSNRTQVSIREFNLRGPELEYARSRGILEEAFEFPDSKEYFFQSWLGNAAALAVYYHSGSLQCTD